MNRTDAQGFFADEETIDKESHVVFTYLLETKLNPSIAAASLCQETSTAQWRRPGMDEDFRPQYAAKVISLETLGIMEKSAFANTDNDGGKYTTARVRIAHPYQNFGTRIPNLLTVAMGEGAFFCGGITTIKLLDIEFPNSFLDDFQGPRFGTKGLRTLLDVTDRPLFFGVVKPNVGLDPKSFAALAKEAWLGGLDAAKDDEMLADPNYSPFDRRMQLVGNAMRDAEETTGDKKMFIANITDEVERLVELHDIAVKSGVNAVMVNVMATGLSAVRMLRKRASVPIVAHFDCIAPMSRHPAFGVNSQVLTKLQRLCGCDAIIMPGFGSRMMTPEEEVLSNVSVCTELLGQIKSALPAPGGSDWAGTLPLVYEKLRTLDFALVPGRGVFGHPMGPRAGALSLHQAWHALVSRVGLRDYAEDHLELKAAIETFGGKAVFEKGQKELYEGAQNPAACGFTGASLFFGNN